MKTKFRIPVMLFLAAMLCALAIVSCKDDEDPLPPTDLTALQASITAATDRLSATVEGRADGQFSTDARTTLQAAIDAAQAVVDNTETTQEQADAAKVSLDTALTTYNEAEITPVAPEALVAWWSFDEGTGTTAADGSDNGFDGTFVAAHEDWGGGLPEWAEDRAGTAGKALHFGTTGGSVEVAYATALNPTDAITVSAWVKSDVIKRGNRFLGLQSWIAYKFELQEGNYPFFSMGYDGGTYDKDAKVPLPNEEWHHVAVTFSAADGKMIFYIDGEMTVTEENLTNTGMSISENPYNLVIGQDFPTDKYFIGDPGEGEEFNDPTSPNYHVIPLVWGGHFEGSLDELRIYNTALSATQVEGLYDRERP
jgi:hypothetical protein